MLFYQDVSDEKRAIHLAMGHARASNVNTSMRSP